MQLRDRGFTLFEVLVYIALFSIIMIGALGGAYQIIESSVKIRTKLVLNQEAHFVFRKIDWVLNGDVVVNNPLPGTVRTDILEVTKDGEGYDFAVDGSQTLTLNGDPLTASEIKVTDFEVTRSPATEPDAILVAFELNNVEFAGSLRYIR